MLHLKESGFVRNNTLGEVEICGSLDSSGFPATLQKLVAARIDQLTPSCITILRVASVIGVEFSGFTLYSICPLHISSDTFAAYLQQLLDRQFIISVDEGIYQFKHQIVQRVSYESFPIDQRQKLHEAIVVLLEKNNNQKKYAAALAYHSYWACKVSDKLKNNQTQKVIAATSNQTTPNTANLNLSSIRSADNDNQPKPHQNSNDMPSSGNTPETNDGFVLKSVNYLRLFAKQCFGLAAIEEEFKWIAQAIELLNQINKPQFKTQKLMMQIQLEFGYF